LKSSAWERLRGIGIKKTGSPKVKWEWNDAQQQVFYDIKQKVGTSLILTNPVKGKPFHLCPDASDYVVRAALEHEGEDGQW